jgi:hypothetical protein
VTPRRDHLSPQACAAAEACEHVLPYEYNSDAYVKALTVSSLEKQLRELAQFATVGLVGEQMANIASLVENIENRFQIPACIREFESSQPFACGVSEIDKLLQGGFPRAALSEISGSPSTNRTALTVSTLVRAFDVGECCAWIDCAGTFDPESAAAAGLQLNRLLWINCKGNPEQALKATDVLLQGGGFGLMVFDVGDVPEGVLRRMPMASWFRFRLAAEKTGTALIVLTPAPQTRSCSAVCVELKRRKSVWRGRLLRGVASCLEIRKHNESRKASFESVL